MPDLNLARFLCFLLNAKLAHRSPSCCTRQRTKQYEGADSSLNNKMVQALPAGHLLMWHSLSVGRCPQIKCAVRQLLTEHLPFFLY